MLDHRRIARCIALQVLYELDTTAHSVTTILPLYANLDVHADDARSLAFQALWGMLIEGDDEKPLPPDDPITVTPNDYVMIQRLVVGVIKWREMLDALISQHAPEWPADQIAVIDRNILRVAIFELVFDTLAFRVVINEAVEIAKMFGTDSSARFINGVLGAVADNRDQLKATIKTDE